jgi:hypothetical protein
MISKYKDKSKFTNKLLSAIAELRDFYSTSRG